jgi:hypothetical protein
MAKQPKELPESEVLAVHARLAAALRSEGFDSFLDWGPIEEGSEQYPVFEEGKPISKKVSVLLSMLNRTRAPRTRALRSRRKAEREAQAIAKGDAKPEKDYQVFDDSLHDKAYLQLKAAALALENAQAAFDEHARNVEEQLRQIRIAEPLERRWARIAAGLGMAVKQLIQESRVVEGKRDVSTFREWDELLSDFAVEMYAAGFTDPQIAAILMNMNDSDAADSINQRRRRRRARQ